VARDAGITGALNWAASQLALPTLADSGYDGAGHGIKTPFKQPVGGQALAPDNLAYNTLHRASHCLGERGLRTAHRPLASTPGSPSAPAASANSPKPHSYSHNSKAANYALLI
jgi:hypothetical protein